jgi:hypothetical protein
LGSIKITHPFHPLYGQLFDILEVKEVNSSRRYSLRTDSGVICVPESWTDRQIQQEAESNSQMIHFDAFTLKELAQFIETLDNFKKQQAILVILSITSKFYYGY